MGFTSTQLGRSFAQGVDQSCHPGPVSRFGVISSGKVEGEDLSQSTGSSISLLLGLSVRARGQRGQKLFHFLADILAPTVVLARYVLTLTADEGSIAVPQPAVDLLQKLLERPVSGEVTLGYCRADCLAFIQVDALVPTRTIITRNK